MLASTELPLHRVGLRYIVTPYVERFEIERYFRPIATRLGADLGVPVTIEVAPTYGEQLERVATRAVELVTLSPLNYVIARQRVPELVPVASEIIAGSPTYSSFIVVRADDGAMRLADLRGRRVVFVDERSASGFLFPYVSLLDAGIDPERDLGGVSFAGTHAAAAMDVLLGRADAAAVASTLFVEEPNTSAGTALDVGALRILYKSATLPLDVTCAVGLSESAVAKVRTAFLRINTRTAAGRDVLGRGRRITGFMAVDDRLYDDIRRALARVSAHRARHGFQPTAVSLRSP